MNQNFAVHTMKGNTASFGLENVAKLIHSIESKDELTRGDIDAIKIEINRFLRENEELLEIDQLDSVSATNYYVSDDEIMTFYLLKN